MKLTAVFQTDPETGWITCWVKEIPQAISQGQTMEEARENLRDALETVLRFQRERVIPGVQEEELAVA